MTREEFIDLYLERSQINEHRTALGYSIGEGHQTVALPCDCEEAECDGWAMIPATLVRWHLYRDMRPHDAEEGISAARAFLGIAAPL